MLITSSSNTTHMKPFSFANDTPERCRIAAGQSAWPAGNAKRQTVHEISPQFLSAAHDPVAPHQIMKPQLPGLLVSAVLTVALAGCLLGQTDPDPSPSQANKHQSGSETFCHNHLASPMEKAPGKLPKMHFPTREQRGLEAPLLPVFL